MRIQTKKITRRSSFYFWFLMLVLFTACQSEKDEASESQAAYKLTGNERFELMDPEATGIVVSNTISEDYQTNILTNAYLYNGGGVAVLDANQDGLQDLYFTATQEPNRLFLNKGNFQFEDVSQQAGVSAPNGLKTGVTVVDINTDGYPDLYVCRNGLQVNDQRRNLLFVNNADGTFSEQAAAYGLDDISASNHANFFDYDLDGDLDVYVLNHPIDFQNVNNARLQETEDGQRKRIQTPVTEYDSDRLYRNNGDGSFTDVTATAGITNRAWGLSVTVSDFNTDGYPDIFVGNDYIEPDFLYINNKNGTFSEQTEDYFRHTSNHTMGVDINDFNNDGLVDVVALDMIAEDNRREKLLMTTMILQRYKTLSSSGYGHQVMRNTLQLNTGQNDFSEIGTFAGISNTDWSWCPLLVDFDNDGYKDLFVANGYRRDLSNLDYLNYTFDSIRQTGGINPQRFPDINDYLDLIPSEPLQNYLYRNKGNLTFEKKSNEWGLVQKTFSNGAAYADLDNDGDLDLIVNNLRDNAFVYRNKSREQDNTSYLQVKLKGPKNNLYGTGAKVQIRYGEELQYFEMTPTRGFLSSVQHLLHFGLDEVQQVDELIVIWPGGTGQTLQNIEVNQVLELDYAQADERPVLELLPAEKLIQSSQNSGLNFTHQENTFEDFDRERLLPHRLSRLGPKLTTGDLNGDGLDDLFVGGASGQSGQVYLQQTNGRFRAIPNPALLADSRYEDMGSAFFDADGDGDLDLYVVSGGNAFQINADQYQDRLYLNDGIGTLTASATLPTLTSSGSCVTPYDYDNDGDLDLFVGGRVSPGAYPKAPQSYILKNEEGIFSDVTQQVLPEFQNIGMISSIHFTDLDGDEQEELVLAGEWMAITVFSQKDGQWKNKTAAFGLDRTNGWWNCLTIEDIDGDGDLDLIAGNTGLNTRLKASLEEPLRIYAKDFDKNGSLDPIMSYYNNGKEYPLVRLENLITQIASIKKKFVHFEPYSTATMDQVFPPEERKDALTLSAYTLQTTFFENNGQGSFKARPLPNQAQLAPTYSIIPTDINADGKLDLLLAGNNYHADVETGRYDAGNGLLLLADGKGWYKPMRSLKSGLTANKDARDLILLELPDGKKLLVVANNNDQLQSFQWD